jgi:hypothetical protein
MLPDYGFLKSAGTVTAVCSCPQFRLKTRSVKAFVREIANFAAKMKCVSMRSAPCASSTRRCGGDFRLGFAPTDFDTFQDIFKDIRQRV